MEILLNSPIQWEGETAYKSSQNFPNLEVKVASHIYAGHGLI